MYSSSLSTHHFIRVLHCWKQCYSSSSPRPFSSCAVFALTSLTDGKWVLFSALFTLEYRKKVTGYQIREYEGCSSIGMRLLGRNFLTKRALWAGALSWCSIQTLFFQRFGRFFRKICRTVSLLISTMSAIILTLRQWSLRTISLIFWMFWLVFKVEGWPGC